MLFLHPCTMRKGAVLKGEVTVMGVSLQSKKKILDGPDAWERHWSSQNFGVMPLPDLYGDGRGTHVAEFMKLATVPSSALLRDRRIAPRSARKAGYTCFNERSTTSRAWLSR